MPMLVGHSQGGIQLVKVLHELAGNLGPAIPVWNPHTDAAEDRVTFLNRGTMKAPLIEAEPWSGPLDPDAHDAARAAAPGWDVHRLEQEWRAWLGENDMVPRSPSRHFVRFCESWFVKRGRP